MATTNKNFKVKNGLDVGGNTVITGDANVTGKLSITAQSGDEGGEIFLSNAATNTTITNGVTIDVYKDRLRFFEQGGDARGFYVDITTGASGASTNLVGGGGGTASNSFATVSANGTSVVADSSSDTLTITPGDGLSIVGNATSDTITFTPNVAGASANGIVTTGSQTFAGEKTFSNNVIASANITANSGYVSADTFRIDTTYTGGTTLPGEIAWDVDEGTVMFQLKDGAVTHRVGQQLDIRVVNNTGSTINEGAVVYINGSSGQEPTIALANAATEGASAQTIGIVTHQGGIANAASGYVCIAGIMRGVDVGAYAAGTPLWLSTTAGQFTDTKPAQPNNGVFLGWVVKAGNGGSILIAVQNGYEIDELHDVLVTDVAAEEVLQRSANNTVWINRTFAEANIANLAATGTQTFSGNVAGTNISVTGNVNAATFSGSGAGLTNIPNSATTASDANGASTIVARNSTGSFTANVVTATTLVGNTNASTITAGTISNARTTASSSNGSSTIVARGSTGNFSSNIITANLFSGPVSTTARVELQRTTTQSVADGSTAIVSFNSTIENVGSYTISSGNVTVPLTGRYSITGYIEWAQNGTNRRVISILKGETVLWAQTAETTSEAGGFRQTISAYSERLAAGDIITLRGRQDAGSSTNINDARLVIDYIGT